MSWTAYEIVFRLRSPMHIGCEKKGNLQTTRPYVMGSNLWGAFTARLTRESGSRDYSKIGKEVDEQMAFSYFYPTEDKNGISHWPWNGDRESFEWRFLGSYVSTAIEGSITLEGTLHEMEFISPRTRDGNQVYLLGYVFEKNSSEIRWKQVIDKLALGGERRYGWGRITPELEISKMGAYAGSELFDGSGIVMDCSADRPILNLQPRATLLAHTVFDSLECEGVLAPLLGRRTDVTSGKLSNPRFSGLICWEPGSRLKSEKVRSIQISDKGLWVPIC